MSKITFSGSFVNEIVIDKRELTRLFCNYKVDNTHNVCVIIPSKKWAGIMVTINDNIVDLNGEYPKGINIIIRKALKTFPNWQD